VSLLVKGARREYAKSDVAQREGAVYAEERRFKPVSYDRVL